MSDPENPERPEGMRVTPEEYDLISKSLTALAEQARTHGQTDVYKAIKRFVVRLQHAVFAGQGVPPERMARLTRAVEKALVADNRDKAAVALSAMIAAVVRTDADPGHTIALNIAPVLVSFVSSVAAVNQAAIAAHTLTKFHERLKTEHDAFEEHGWPKKPADALEYAATLAAFCAAEFKRGADPFQPPANDAPEGEPN